MNDACTFFQTSYSSSDGCMYFRIASTNIGNRVIRCIGNVRNDCKVNFSSDASFSIFLKMLENLLFFEL